MNSPMGMSFEEIRAQAEANIKNDNGQEADTQSQTQGQNQTQGQSFLDMVEAAKRNNNTTGSQPAQQQTQPQAETKQPAPQPVTDQNAGQTGTSKAGGAGEMSFEELFAKAQSSSQTAGTFDAMYDQAEQNQTGESAKTEPMNPPVSEQTAEPDPAPVTGNTASFDDLMKMAQSQIEAEAATAQEAPAEEPAQEAPAEESAQEEAPAEEPAQEKAPVEETPAQEEVPVEETPAQETPIEETLAQEEAPTEEPVEETLAQEEAPTEEPAKEETPTKKSRAKKGSKKKEEEPKEPLPDETDNYKVDVLGEDDVKKPEEKVEEQAETNIHTSYPATMEALFTPEEIEEFRTVVRTIVRSEFKKALVGAVKEFMAELSE